MTTATISLSDDIQHYKMTAHDWHQRHLKSNSNFWLSIVRFRHWDIFQKCSLVGEGGEGRIVSWSPKREVCGPERQYISRQRRRSITWFSKVTSQ